MVISELTCRGAASLRLGHMSWPGEPKRSLIAGVTALATAGLPGGLPEA
jgi:hypothetical protein